jgi:hypothetical protein
MIPCFDVFQVEDDGKMLWLDAVATMEEARALVRGLASSGSRDYVILNQITGSKAQRDGRHKRPADQKPRGENAPWKIDN